MISTLYRANANYLLRHPWQLALTLLGISIGVAVIIAVDLANSSSRKAFLLSMDAVTGRATHQVIGGPRGIDEDFYVALRVEHGIRSIAPVVEGYITVKGRSLQVLGVDLLAEQEMRSSGQVSSASSSEQSSNGNARQSFLRDILTTPGAVVLSQSAADALGIAVGEPFEVTAGGKQHWAVLLATYADDVGAGLDNLVTADIGTAQVWFNLVGRLTRIDVRSADTDSEFQDRLQKLLPADSILLAAAARTRTTAEMSAAL